MKVLRGSGSPCRLLPVSCSQQLIHTLLMMLSFFTLEATEFGCSCFGSSHVLSWCIIYRSRSNETRCMCNRSKSTSLV